MIIHRGPRIQRGRGFGNIFSSIARFLLPVARNGFKHLTSGVKNIAKSSIGKGLKKAVITSGKQGAINVLSDAIAGKKVKDSVSSEVKNAKAEIAKVLRKSTKKPHPIIGPKKRKLKKGLLD